MSSISDEMPPAIIDTALSFSLERLAALFCQSFEGYFVPIAVTAPSLAHTLVSDNVDLAASVVAVVDGEPAGLVLVGRRGQTRRIGAMGVCSNHRRSGVGRAMLEHVIAARGDASRMVLEVIRSNDPAIGLYETARFTPTRVLHGFTGTWNGATAEPPSPARLDECDPMSVRQTSSNAPTTPPPWQLEHHPPWPSDHDRGFALGPARCFANVRPDGPCTIRWIEVDSSARRRGWALACLSRVMALAPDATWRVPEIVPDEWPTTAFTTLGLRRSPIEQLEMHRLFGAA